MNTLGHAVILVAIFVSIALLGQRLLKGRIEIEVLEQHHSAAEGMLGVVGTLFSVLLGFMVAAAMARYGDAQMHVEQEANNVASIFRLARGLSDVDRPRIRDLCRQYAREVVEIEWEQMEHHAKINHGWEGYQKLWEGVVSVVPENDRQSNLQQALNEAMMGVGEHRRARLLLARQDLPNALWIVVAFGSIITIGFTYVFMSQFPHIHGFMTTMVATTLALNIWLLSAYSSPFSGELQIKPMMFTMLNESVFPVPDTPSRYLHDNAPAKSESNETRNSRSAPAAQQKPAQ
ncbi:MAG: DUF4239 domain-containing protein [Candidatus Obscuribacterales bacterium]|nr:DUF4239 domain-containing protein [Candidatus Obscuribacterales bacterium]